MVTWQWLRISPVNSSTSDLSRFERLYQGFRVDGFPTSYTGQETVITPSQPHDADTGPRKDPRLLLAENLELLIGDDPVSLACERETED